MLPIVLLVSPLVTGLLTWLAPSVRIRTWMHIVGTVTTSVAGVWLALAAMHAGLYTVWNERIYIDSLGAYMLLIISCVGFLASIYSIGYVRRDVAAGKMEVRRSKWYYLWFHLFMMTMLFVCIVNNIGMIWVGIEATTLVSALLVGFYNHKHAVEAAWKYLIICSVGIALALVGIILLYSTAFQVVSDPGQALHWSVLTDYAAELDSGLVQLAFIFLFIGLGTKAGLAPMHFWLPDAHSQAPTPVSAVLSGVLLNCALYGLLRFHIVVSEAVGAGFSSSFFLYGGLLSIAFALPFILVQQDLKRLLAYSSVEHMGIISVGIGLGSELAIYGALLHMFFHALAKSALFMLAGRIYQIYQSRRIERIRGMMRALPLTATLFMMGVLAIAGAPPFSLFVSEFTIFLAAFQQGNGVISFMMVLLVFIIFTGFIYHLSRMVFAGRARAVVKGETSRATLALIAVPLGVMILFALYHPALLEISVVKTASILLQK